MMMVCAVLQVLDEAATKGLEQKEQVVDFFGSSVKAQELVARAEELNELAKRARQFEDSPQSFLLDHQARMRPPAWAKVRASPCFPSLRADRVSR